MLTLKLAGRLGKEFGREYKLDVTSTAEAIRALCYQLKGFEDAFKQGEYRIIRVSGNGARDLSIDDLHLGVGRAREVRIVPVARGAKRGGLGKILLGVLIIGAAFMGAGFAVSGLANPVTIGGTAMGSMTYGYLATIGGMMLLNGVSSMLSPQQSSSDADKNKSYTMDATGNRIEQGSPVPIIFGEVFTGSVVVSVGISIEELPIGA